MRAYANERLTRAQRESMKAHIRQPLRHLDEAGWWLTDTDLNTYPLIFKMVDVEVQVAVSITTGVQWKLDSDGPDAEVVGSYRHHSGQPICY